jgi:hypothetical protein
MNRTWNEHRDPNRATRDLRQLPMRDHHLVVLRGSIGNPMPRRIVNQDCFGG